MPLPPNVPAKPISKSVGLSSGASRRATTSSMFAQMHSSLADAFTKPPKQFATRVFVLMNFNNISMIHSSKKCEIERNSVEGEVKVQ